MKRVFGKIYAALLLILMAAGESFVIFYFAWFKGTNRVAAVSLGLAGWLLSCVLAPTIHELGHIVAAKKQGMRLKMSKFSFFRLSESAGKLRVSFASPFAAEETQCVPLMGGGMKKRAILYTAGGLIGGGVYLFIVLLAALLTGLFSKNVSFLFWGGVPYAAYLLLLNALPFVYGEGKTDAAVLKGIVKEAGAEKAMVYAMEIYGELSEGKSFSEIDEKYYFDLPQLPEDEPMYAMTLDLRYRYYVEKGDMKNAADCLNRLAASAQYLPQAQFDEVAAELVYMHSLNKDTERAEESGKLCKEYLGKDTAQAKRILAAYCAMLGKTEEVKALKAQAEDCLSREEIEGVKKFERTLLSRIPEA